MPVEIALITGLLDGWDDCDGLAGLTLDFGIGIGAVGPVPLPFAFGLT